MIYRELIIGSVIVKKGGQTNMKVTIGLIPSPDMPHKLINKIYSELPKDFKNHVDSEVEWQFDMHIASMIGTAEHMDKALDICLLYTSPSPRD